jgi:FAD/FMN-containing dehydrogenase
MNTATMTALRVSMTGQIVLPEDEAYERLRNTFVHTGTPAIVVRCHDIEDVQCAVRHARDNALVLSIRSGGHSGVGFGTNDGGMVIDLSPIDDVEVVDAQQHIVRIGTGAQWIDVATTLGTHGVAISSGDTTTVGVGGLLLGGGIGWMVRRYGLALDTLLAAEVVTADGQALRASRDEHADLFWGLRGGGGNFGVVTTFEVAAQPVGQVLFGTVTYPAHETAAVLRRWRDHMRTAPDDITTTARMFPTFGGPPAPLIIAVGYAGDDVEAGTQAIAPLLDLGDMVEQDIRRMPYADVLDAPGELPPAWRPWVRNRFARDLSDALIDTITTGAGTIGSMFVEIRGLGGHFGRVPRDATAFVHRDSEVMITTALLGSPDDHQRVASEFEAFWRALSPWTAGAYGNFLSTADEEDIASVYPPDTYRRLAAVKRTYDPDNLFNQNHNIRPAR